MRKRLVLITLIGIVPLTLFVQWSDMVVGGTMAAGPYPPLAACIQWAALLGVVAIARRAGFRELLTRGELLATFGIWAAANVMAGRGMVHPILTSLAGPAYYARSGAALKAVHEHLPSWMAVRDAGAVTHFFEGYGLPVPWGFWRTPLLTWALFFIPFLTANLCLAMLFERVWVEHERLAFPLVTLPMEMLHWGERATDQTFRRVFAIGLMVPVLLHGFGVAHAYVPAVPCLPFFNDVSYLAASPPWSVLKPLYLNIYPLLIGVTFLAPVDVSFSIWFFLLVNKIELLGASVSGWSEGASGGSAPSPPFLEEQSAGAYLALAAVLIWNARRRIATFGRSLSPGSPNDEDPGGSRHRLAASAFAIGAASILVWCVWTGIPLWLAASFFGFYFAVALVLSRLMAESGLPWLLAPILPDKLILSLTGSAAVTQQTLTRLTLHVQHLRDTRQMAAPAILHAGRLRAEGRVKSGPFYVLLLVGIFLTLSIGIPAALTNFYSHGALSLTPNSDGMMMTASVIPTTGVNQLSSRLVSPLKPSLPAGLAVCGGAALTLILSGLRNRTLWWPLNPLGYALTGTLQTGYANKMLLSIMLGWLFKTIILRFWGASGFRMLRGAALGLIFGDLLVGAVLKLLDALLGPSGYAIF